MRYEHQDPDSVLSARSASPRLIPPRALLLDIGNVVIRWSQSRLLGNLAAATGRMPEDVERAFLGSPLDGLFHKGRYSAAEFLSLLNAAFGTSVPADAFAAAWNDVFDPYPEAEALVRELAPQIPLVAVTNTNALHYEHLRRAFPILGAFRAVVASHEVGSRKPEPGIFRAALDAAGCRPAEALFVDDLEGNVAGAADVGIPGIVFRGVPGLREDLAARGVPVAA